MHTSHTGERIYSIVKAYCWASIKNWKKKTKPTALSCIENKFICLKGGLYTYAGIFTQQLLSYLNYLKHHSYNNMYSIFFLKQNPIYF